jgi:hypothetical protein
MMMEVPFQLINILLGIKKEEVTVLQTGQTPIHGVQTTNFGERFSGLRTIS